LGEQLTGVGHRPAFWSRAPYSSKWNGQWPSPHLSLA